jgi:predicted DNA-binding protein (UPF0278 family)
MRVTFDLPEEMITQLHQVEDQLPRMLELGLRELTATSQTGFSGAAEVLEFFASQPTPEVTLALRPSEALQDQISELLEKIMLGLGAAEEQVWQSYQYLEHLVRMAKAKALLRLQEARNQG